MAYWAKDGSFVREASDDAPRRTQGDDWEAQQRVSKGLQDWERGEARRKEAERNLRAETYQFMRDQENKRMAAIENERNQMEAKRIIVEQKRQEYNKKSWFGKSVAALRGRTFNKMRDQIEDYAERRIENMTPEQLETFVQNNSEEKGRAR